ncbi:ribosomal RNA small subunit methyltransferase I [Lactobacillus selangorensis]|uniref:Ribosomal RNA small subunit methyltransferase I n=1 Tax=Lactobacillus selangorensis TaxID=81857 RepID=A0A0R2FGQ7_9LACO|nr:16S rRNA (cytidine(1402)-2'-O)-methyltransferase [Lactobacillus selangorensis]KRN27422.1 ribosomal RNA small subunit methyltransferase I [Lactobacillus selangorensis]KRN31381.1 ribosomal RNA small subunit methyltransferase I [Lactobacillus selangorensis]
MDTQKSFSQPDAGHLYLVPTPIGNLEDMTYRAVRTLKDVDLIAAEDTRHTQQLLNHFEISTHQISFHEHNSQARIPELVAKMQAGQDIAQVSDAGMPSISDPGHDLVMACIAAKIAVIPLPGANAGMTALIASGLSPQPFYFWGFLPRKKGDLATTLDELADFPETIIFYEAPHRLKKTLQALAKHLGGERQIVVCRELTKKFEEFIRGDLKQVVQWSTETEIRGEFVLIVEGSHETHAELDNDLAAQPLRVQVETWMERGERTNDAIKKVAKANGLKRQVVYDDYHQITKE